MLASVMQRLLWGATRPGRSRDAGWTSGTSYEGNDVRSRLRRSGFAASFFLFILLVHRGERLCSEQLWIGPVTNDCPCASHRLGFFWRHARGPQPLGG